MALHPAEPDQLQPARPGLLAGWMASQRWFANKGHRPELEEVGRFGFAAEQHGLQLVTHLLLDRSRGEPVLYQVPVAYRAAPLPDRESALIGMLGSRYAYDAPHDPAYTGALLEFITAEGHSRGEHASASGHRTSDPSDGRFRSRVLTGEQSNTSIVYEPADGGTPVICKLFRTLHHGDNPDVVLQTVLADAGSAVPATVGHLVADWPDPGQPSGRARGHLAFAQEYLVGARDGWRLAREAAAAGQDFTADADAIGGATAGVHATLAARLPTAGLGAQQREAALASLDRRLRAAVHQVPELGRLRPAIGAIMERARHAPASTHQRIHGDLHLGQVLRTSGRGWILIDFEGEPLRPMVERSGLDNPLRDVAGMLRSLDYVSGSLALEGSAPDDEWVSGARSAFKRGYTAASGYDLAECQAVLDALELDKALYEAVYEARNRPAWLGIPVSGIERLCARAAA